MVPILLAIHDYPVRATMRALLTLCGYTVAGEASTAEEAIEKFKEINPGFVVLDFDPEKFDVIKAIKGIRAINSEVMIIVHSSGDSRSPMIEAMNLGIKDWVFNMLPTQPERFMISVDLLIGDAHRIEVMKRLLKEDIDFCFGCLRKANIYGL